MGAQALLRPLLLPLFLALCGQPPGAAAQSCSVDQNIFQIEENTHVTEALVNITVPAGQHVTLGSESTPFAFRILDNQLFLNVTPDYEENAMLQALLECRSGSTVVTQLRVFVIVLDVNDNAPVFPFTTKEQEVEEDTKVNTIVIPESELQATDLDKDELYYTLQEVTPGASNLFSLVGANQPALRLDSSLDVYRWQNITFQLLARDTWEEKAEPSHTATATLLLRVTPADLRPPWFLPCTYSDGYVCIQAQYYGAVPTGHILTLRTGGGPRWDHPHQPHAAPTLQPSPLILRPGPIHAVDGDRAINQPIVYSIAGGNTNDVFTIDADTGNLTMASSIPSPTTFFLVVRAEQADQARYSVTQVTVEARVASGSPPSFPQSLYRGFVALGSGPGVAVMDADSPSQSLRIWAQDPEFPDLNSAITYRITNCSEFKMDGEAVLTATELEQAGVFYAEVEAQNTVTSSTATTVAEIHVSEQAPSSTGPPVPPTSPETGGTARPWSSTVSQAPGPPTTSSGGGTGPHPPSGTTPRPSVSPTTGRPSSGGAGTTSMPPTPSRAPSQTSKPGVSQPTTPSGGAGTSPGPPTPSGGPAQTPKPGASQPTTPSVGSSTSHRPATPGGGPAQTLKPVTSLPTAPGPSRSPSTSGMPGGGGAGGGGVSSDGTQEDQRFSVVDMAVLGGVLGALLLLALIGLVVLIYKHYGLGKAKELQTQGFDNQAFLKDEANWVPAPSPSPDPQPADALPTPPPLPVPPVLEPPSAEPLGHGPGSPTAARAGDSPSAVKSILTKERRPEGGYKAVWFGEDIGADVVVLNTPTADADAAGDEDSGGSGDEDTGRGGGLGHLRDADSTYI